MYNTRTTEMIRFVAFFFFARVDEPWENYNITVLSLLNPGCRLSPLGLPHFLRCSSSKKRAFALSSLSLSLFLLPPFSGFILSTRASPELFCLLAREHLNGAPAPLKRPCLNPSSGDVNADRGKTRDNHAQFYGKPSRGLSRRRKEPREKEQENEREKCTREWKMTYLMIFSLR